MSCFFSKAIFGIASCVALLCGPNSSTKAQEDTTNQFYEIETKYIFGFTEGSSIGLQGEREISFETVAAFGKRDGRYSASETKLEFEHTPTQFMQFELGALISTHNIQNVTDLDNRNAVSFGGLFGEFRYLLLERGSLSPFAVTVSIEPVWRRTDETSGERVTNFELETKLAADTEVIPNRLYLGFNVLYEPETTRMSVGGWNKESTFGASSALAFRIVPKILIGAEFQYFRHYDGIGFNTYTGDASFLGPTIYVQLTNKSFLTAAYETQISGHAIGDPSSLNLTDFPKNRAKLKFALEF